MRFLIGNLLTSSCDVICHQVNCKGTMGSGIALQISKKFPKVYKVYREKYLNCGPMLGTIDCVPCGEKIVINMYAQNDYGYGKRQTNYEAFYQCLQAIDKECLSDTTIGFPYNIGCCRGGASWNVIKAMIEDVLGYRGDKVVVYKLEGKQ